MIYAIIALIIAGVVIALLSVINIVAIGRNSRLEREKKFDMRALEEALAGKEALKAENGKLQQELHFVQVENADLSESLRAGGEEFEKTRLLYGKLRSLEAQPTAPKRVVRKPPAQTTE